jgi:mannose-6-phosphate isomerase-like protein (cupin superfamily)
MRKVAIGLAGIVAAALLYLALGHVILPPQRVQLSNYFKPGDRLVSRFEGFDQTITAVDGDWLRSRLEVAPHAAGPPEHFHENFEERFTVRSGTLSIMVNGEKRTLQAGETLVVPPMTRHKPFNETGETVIVESDDANSVPVQFGYILSQLYGFMDRYPNGPSTPQMIMQLSVYGNEADSWLADGPPLSVQKAMRLVLSPAARVVGYSNYYPEYRPHR